MQEVSLRAFLHEYRIRFPVGIDAPGAEGERIPETMRAYGLQGTPSTLLIDGAGRLRDHHFGVYDDLILGASIQHLLDELKGTTSSSDRDEAGSGQGEDRPGTCTEDTCSS